MLKLVLWLVTLLRVALIPVFVVLATRAHTLAAAGADPTGAQGAGAAVLVVMGLSDLVDGWMARRFDLATQLGAIVDAAADKLIQVGLVTFFTVVEGPAYASLPWWFLAVIVARDLLIGGGMLLAWSRSVPLKVVHRAHGRLSSALVFVVLGWLAFQLPREPLAPALVGVAGLIAVSGAIYLADGILQARDVLRARRRAPDVG